MHICAYQIVVIINTIVHVFDEVKYKFSSTRKTIDDRCVHRANVQFNLGCQFQIPTTTKLTYLNAEHFELNKF
jgi:hypothetical protein